MPVVFLSMVSLFYLLLLLFIAVRDVYIGDDTYSNDEESDDKAVSVWGGMSKAFYRLFLLSGFFLVNSVYAVITKDIDIGLIVISLIAFIIIASLTKGVVRSFDYKSLMYRSGKSNKISILIGLVFLVFWIFRIGDIIALFDGQGVELSLSFFNASISAFNSSLLYVILSFAVTMSAIILAINFLSFRSLLIRVIIKEKG